MSDCILVLGDVMLDRHIHGVTDRVSPEAPVPVVLRRSESWSLGGAANVAAHVREAGLDCELLFKGFRVEGFSDAENIFYAQCAQRGITLNALGPLDGVPLTVKTRIWANGQQVCRLDDENVDKPDGKAWEATWVGEVLRTLDRRRPSAVIFSDYDKGTLSDAILYNVAMACKGRGIPTVFDPKRRTFPKVRGMTVVKPNVREVRSTGMSAEECSAAIGDSWLVNTLGSDGMAVFQHGERIYSLPTVASEVVDVCGCGDTVAALLALALARGKGIEEAVKAANKGASFTIRHRGSYVPTKQEMESCF